MRHVLLGFVCVFFVNTACVADSTSDALWNKLSAIQSMKASFTQKIYAKTRELSQSSGDMAFVRPEQFRWQTEEPMEQLLIADGKKIWMYDVLLEQVTVKQQTEAMGAAAGLFLSDNKARFTHDFYVKYEQQGKFDIFKLKARAKQANIERMMLKFKGEYLESMDLYDQLGQHTVVHFSQVNINTTLQKKLFQFIPPAGVDVVEQ